MVKLAAGGGRTYPGAGLVAVAEGLLDLVALRLRERGHLGEDVAQAVVGVGPHLAANGVRRFRIKIVFKSF